MEKMTAAPSGPPIIREEQRFRQPWLMLVILGLSALIWYGAWQQLVRGVPFGDNPAPDWMMVVLWLLIGIGMPLFFIRLSMVTEVRTDGIYLRYWPLLLRWRRLSWEGLERVQAVSYRPVRDYGGWGIRLGPKGNAYSISGNRGVLITRKEGADVMIGSQQPERLVGAVREAGGPA